MGYEMLKRIIKKSAHTIAPKWAAECEQRLDLSRNAKRLRTQCNQMTSLEEVVTTVMNCSYFRPIQKNTEILRLLITLARIQPRYICEIGAAGGGSLFLFSQVASPDARILSIDMNYVSSQLRTYPHLARNSQQITCLRADSHSVETIHKVTDWLKDRKLDFLFIDGDHSMPGVSSDFSLYSQHVRQAGLIAFHDIVPDFRTRYGIPTQSDVGQVPAFWANLKHAGHKTCEIIEDPQQDGYGIGLLHWQPKGVHDMNPGLSLPVLME